MLNISNYAWDKKILLEEKRKETSDKKKLFLSADHINGVTAVLFDPIQHFILFTSLTWYPVV